MIFNLMTIFHFAWGTIQRSPCSIICYGWSHLDGANGSLSLIFICRQKKYKLFQEFHMSGMGFIVGPLMAVELITGAMLLIIYKLSNIYFFSSMLLLVGIWFLTAIVFTRIHSKLLNGYSEKLIHDLISFNWFRTIMWTTRLVLLSFFWWIKLTIVKIEKIVQISWSIFKQFRLP